MLTLQEYEALQPHCELSHNGVTVRYATPTTFTRWRVESLFEKEPVTIDWIASVRNSDAKPLPPPRRSAA